MTSAQRLPNDGSERFIVVPMSSKCEVCAYVAVHGYTPARVIDHCGQCHHTASGHSELHCTTCHRSFGGDQAFLAHQVGDVCRDPSTLRFQEGPFAGQPRFKLVERKHGMVWVTVVNKRSEPSQGLPEATTEDDATGDHPSPDRVSVHRDSPRRRSA